MLIIGWVLGRQYFDNLIKEFLENNKIEPGIDVVNETFGLKRYYLNDAFYIVGIELIGSVENSMRRLEFSLQRMKLKFDAETNYLPDMSDVVVRIF